ncbi:MAG: SurA N-terminal domain-containing protein [Geminicoccaceae bacterium]
MLDSLRRHATGWVAKVLFGVLVVSFAVWGIGDVFRAPHGGSTLAEVAGTPISMQEVSGEFDRRLQQMQQQFGNNLDRRAAVSIGLLQQSVDAAVARRLVDAHAEDLGLTASDEAVAEAIRQNPQLQGTGGFDRSRFDLLLRSLGMSEANYIAAVRGDMVRGELVDTLTGSVQAPDLLVRKLLEERLEQRRGKVLIVDSATIEVPSPTEDELSSYLAANAKAYEAPEYRSITLVTLAPEDLVGEIEISDADLRAAYDARAAQYRKPEQRRIEQLLAPDEATIKRAAELVAGGKSFTDVASEMSGDKVERSELGPLAKGDLPEALDQAAFGLPQGEVSTPVQTPFGWHLLRTEEVIPEQVEPFEAVADELRRELSLDRASNQLPDVSTRLDDELAAGTPLDEAASKQGLEALKLENVDRTGHNAAHERLAADRLTSDILAQVFAANAGETSLLEQTADGHYYVFRVDDVQPARERPLSEVRDQVEQAWRAEQQKAKAKARAEELRAAASDAASLADLAKANADTRLVEVAPLLRTDDGAQQGLSAAAVAAMFATPVGEVAKEVVEIPDGAAVVAVEEVIPAKIDDQMLNATRNAVANSLRAEMLGAYETALRARYPVSVNQSTLATLMEQLSQ